MSAKRTKKKKSEENYPTPDWATLRFAERCEAFATFGKRWIEPAAGSGAIIEAINIMRNDIEWTAVELRNTEQDLRDIGIDKTQIHNQNFLTEYKTNKKFDVAITNPPFSLTMEFLERMRAIADHAIIFQSINFLGSSDRNEFMTSNTPDVYLLPDRVSHTANGQTDSVYSAWFHWSPQSAQETHRARFKVLPCTALEKRKAAHASVQHARDDDARMIDSLFAADLF